MATYETPIRQEHGPFRAIIGTDGNFASGHIRVEPPFQPGEALTDYSSADGLEISHFATTDKATLLDYYVSDPDHESDNLSLISEEVDYILEHLGGAALKKNFVEYWRQF